MAEREVIEPGPNNAMLIKNVLSVLSILSARPAATSVYCQDFQLSIDKGPCYRVFIKNVSAEKPKYYSFTLRDTMQQYSVMLSKGEIEDRKVTLDNTRLAKKQSGCDEQIHDKPKKLMARQHVAGLYGSGASIKVIFLRKTSV
ncbi:hypothetical protein BsWGS_17882 [Bradybaena similaris]